MMATPTEVAVGALQRVGLAVRGYPGWERRSAGSFAPHGIMFHHDASPVGPSPSVRDWLAFGAPFAPAAHFWVDMEGVWWVITNGRANHAGTGGPWGVIGHDEGNYAAFGVETDHTVGEVWPALLYRSLVAGFAAIIQTFAWPVASSVLGHKEYAPTRKVDPDGVNMSTFRAEVAAGGLPIEPAPPKKEPRVPYLIWNSEKSTSPLLMLNNGKVFSIVDGDSVKEWERVGAKRVAQTDRDYRTIMTRGE